MKSMYSEKAELELKLYMYRCQKKRMWKTLKTAAAKKKEPEIEKYTIEDRGRVATINDVGPKRTFVFYTGFKTLEGTTKKNAEPDVDIYEDNSDEYEEDEEEPEQEAQQYPYYEEDEGEGDEEED